MKFAHSYSAVLKASDKVGAAAFVASVLSFIRLSLAEASFNIACIWHATVKPMLEAGEVFPAADREYTTFKSPKIEAAKTALFGNGRSVKTLRNDYAVGHLASLGFSFETLTAKAELSIYQLNSGMVLNLVKTADDLPKFFAALEAKRIEAEKAGKTTTAAAATGGKVRRSQSTPRTPAAKPEAGKTEAGKTEVAPDPAVSIEAALITQIRTRLTDTVWQRLVSAGKLTPANAPDPAQFWKVFTDVVKFGTAALTAQALRENAAQRTPAAKSAK